jgi:hypothetical protein
MDARARRAIGAVRLVVAALIVAAVTATFLDTAAHTVVNPFNFFGYFTVQSNLVDVVVLAVGGARLLSGRPAGRIWTVIRWAATDSMVAVGLVYAILLAPLGAAGGVPVPWANSVLHIITPVFAVLDWFLAPDRGATPLQWLWALLIHPAVWLGVVLARGATDGWVPYPFLDPKNGYWIVGGICAVLAGGFALIGLVLRLADRVPTGRDLAAAPA